MVIVLWCAVISHLDFRLIVANVKVRFHLEENVGPSWWFEEDNKIFS